MFHDANTIKDETNKTGIVQHAFSEDADTNRARNITGIENLAAEGAQLVVLSELHDFLFTSVRQRMSTTSDMPMRFQVEFTEIYSAAARDNNVVVVASMFERRAPGLYHNTALVFDRDGSIAGRYRKMHIPDDPGFLREILLYTRRSRI